MSSPPRVNFFRRYMMPSSDVEADDDVYTYKPACGNREKIYAVGSSVALVMGVIIACIVSSVHKVCIVGEVCGKKLCTEY